MAQLITISRVKLSLKISHTALDSDINDEIDSCLADLTMCGIVTPDETDSNILTAIRLWCKAAYSDDVAKRAQFSEAYDKFKACLMMAGGYGNE